MKKILSLLLSVVMCSTVLVICFPAYALSQSGECGDNVSYSFNELTGELTISGEGEIWDFDNESDNYSPFHDEESIKKVVIEEGITGIGDYTFSGCSGITEINMPDSLVHIGLYAFMNCESITNIVILDGVTRIYEGAFLGCTALTSITIPKSVRVVYGNPFDRCSSLNTVFYDGSEDDWNSIMITKNYTEELLAAKLVYCAHNSYVQTKVVFPTYTSNGYSVYKCLNCGGHFKSDITEQLVLPFNTETSSEGEKTYIIELKQSGYLTYDFAGDGTINYLKNIEIYDEDGLRADTSFAEYNNFLKKCYIKDTVALLAGKYYVKVNWHNQIEYTDDSFTLSLSFQPVNETFIKTKNSVHNDALTAIEINLDQTYNGFLCDHYGAGIDSYWFEIPNGSKNTEIKFSLSVTQKPNFATQCYIDLLNENAGKVDGFDRLFVDGGTAVSKTVSLTGGKYYVVINKIIDSFPVEYTFKTETVDHTWDKGKIIKKTTPTATGIKTYTCTVCGATKTETIAKCAKYANTLTVKAKKPTVKYSSLKKKNQTIALNKWATVTKAQGKVTYAKASGNKKITVTKNGKITVKKGLKKGTYAVKIKVKAAGNTEYNAAVKIVTVKIKVK